jgi:hypothetical protein
VIDHRNGPIEHANNLIVFRSGGKGAMSFSFLHAVLQAKISVPQFRTIFKSKWLLKRHAN